MRSAIFYPDIEIDSEDTMRAALLMWDELKVIVPWEGYKPAPQKAGIQAAWELIGSTMCPDHEQKQRAHESIRNLLSTGVAVDVLYRDGIPPAAAYEMWPQKLLPETWDLLKEQQLAGPLLANGDYPFEEQGALAIMAKLADACAGDSFARWTDRFLAYGLVADRDPAAAAQTTVVPLTLQMIDATRIPLESLIAFRRREQTETRGDDYRNLRHRYTDKLVKHVEATKSVKSDNQLSELRRQFEEEMRTDLRDLREALGSNILDTWLSPVVVTSVVAVGSWLATNDPTASIAAAAAGGGATRALEKVLELFRLRNGFNAKQRKTMADHPMAYLYQLSRSY